MTLPTDNAKRKALPLWDYFFGYFFDAFLAEVEVAVAGNEQHNPGEPLHWAREKSTDQLNTALRHQADYGRGVKKDTDGCWHLAKAIWRLKAQLQLDIEAERREGGSITAPTMQPTEGEERSINGVKYYLINGKWMAGFANGPPVVACQTYPQTRCVWCAQAEREGRLVKSSP